MQTLITLILWFSYSSYPKAGKSVDISISSFCTITQVPHNMYGKRKTLHRKYFSHSYESSTFKQSVIADKYECSTIKQSAIADKYESSIFKQSVIADKCESSIFKQSVTAHKYESFLNMKQSVSNLNEKFVKILRCIKCKLNHKNVCVKSENSTPRNILIINNINQYDERQEFIQTTTVTTHDLYCN